MNLKISLRQRLRMLSWILFSSKQAKTIFDSKTSTRLVKNSFILSVSIAVVNTVIAIHGILSYNLLISISAVSFSALIYYIAYADYLKARKENSRLIKKT